MKPESDWIPFAVRKTSAVGKAETSVVLTDEFFFQGIKQQLFKRLNIFLNIFLST